MEDILARVVIRVVILRGHASLIDIILLRFGIVYCTSLDFLP